MTTQTLLLSGEKDTQKLAKSLAAANLSGSVWLSGDLGAGKTTLVRYWLQAMGHQGAVKSPTYTLVEPYHIAMASGDTKSVYHADLYRLNDSQELDFIGFYEYFNEPNSLVIIEWASRADTVLPQPDYRIDIVREHDDSRNVILMGFNVDFGDVCGAITEV